jgi:enamine deaminase RidA (YjgF/YER057c/UK114 family)
MGAAAIVAFLPSAAFGQPAPGGINPNVYVNPNAGRFPNTGALGQGLANAPPGGGLGYNTLGPGGYGSLSASYANPGLGYGSLLNSSSNNGGYSGGYGMYGTQWMQNPYQGYLSGAADITRANADYQQGIQQARLLREESRRSALQTRRAMLEEAEWERAHMPDPEKIRQQALAKELDRARVHPPLNDIRSARSLNALLRHLIAQQGQGARGPLVAINEETLEHINLTVGDTRGNVGMLKDGGKLEWPLPLQGEAFADARESLTALMKDAYKSVMNGNNPTTANLSDLRANLAKMQEVLNANVDTLRPDEYLTANRYLRYVKDTITALKDPNVTNFFNKNWMASAKDVSQLVRFMREKGLWFAPATPKDSAAYQSLYYALASFDAGMQRVASTGGDDDK